MNCSKTLTALCMALLPLAGTAVAQKKKPSKDKPVAKEKAATDSRQGFTDLPSGIAYKVVKHGQGTHKAGLGDHAELFIHINLDDSVVFDSRKMFNADKPVPVVIQPPRMNGDLMEGFQMMVAGDSAVFYVPVDSMLKMGGQPMPGMKPGIGQMMRYEVQMVSVRTEAEDRKHNEEMAAKQKVEDEKLLKDYFKKHKLEPKTTASGLYYTVEQQGTGPVAKAGDKLSVMYTGKLLNGNVFDSNIDSAFHHPEPFKVEIGKGAVIKGWDEGMVLFNKGTKATLYIPSGLAYGAQDRSPQIPANSILVFEIQLLDIEKKMGPAEQAKKDDQLLQEYFTKNNIKATKTASGLYYAIRQEGLGDKAQPGKKVTLNYTGKLLDGTVFDSNEDPKFNHVEPFSFVLGQGNVIKGWDEGVQQLKVGSKGSFYIPSGLAYGANSPNPKIPANAVMVFDVELVGIE